MSEEKSSDFEMLPPPIQGNADWRSFRCLRLRNGVKVCLVHDKESKTTAAAATVNAGAGADPRSMPGLAHFCEHMVFLGSEKYPGENEYKSFLAQHGGRSNASTSMNLTTYKFEVLAPHAEKALDIFSNFFVAPLFTHSSTSREVFAIDSENSKNLVADIRRRLQVLKTLADPEHYYSKFSTGNSKTLPSNTSEEVDKLRSALLAFHSKHYRPDQLTVVVAGPQSLDELQEWVVPRFVEMTSRPFPANGETKTLVEALVDEGAKDAPAFDFETISRDDYTPIQSWPFRSELQDGRWPIMITTKPVRSVRRLVMMFPLPSVHLEPDRAPSSFLSHLLGHEGPMSSFAVLQNAGLLTSLSAGSRSTGPDFSLFQIDMGLTEQGEAEWKNVVDVILQHCRLISMAASESEPSSDGKTTTAEDLRRIWEESAKLRSMFFHQSSPGGVYQLAPDLSSSIVKHGTKKALAAGCMLDESAETFPLEEVAKFASLLAVENCFVERCSESAWEEMVALEKAGPSDACTRKTEQWYGVDYFLSLLPEEYTSVWSGKKGSFFDANDLLELPRANLFVPRTLELCEELPEEAKLDPRIEKPIDPPQLLVDDPSSGRLWHRLDDRYALPKAVFTVLIRNSAVTHKKGASGKWEPCSEASVHSSLLSGIFSQAMAQETYDAELAGLDWSLSMSVSGIQLKCSGFSDRLPDLALKVLRDFTSGEFLSESFFGSVKDRILRSLRTYFTSRRADAYGVYYRDFVLTSVDLGVQNSLKITEAATLESTKQYLKDVLGNEESYLECLCIGNVSEQNARKFYKDAFDVVSGGSAVGKTSQSMWIPDILERRMGGHDIELHFASQNTQEENGSVLVTFQSPVPAFRGELMSSDESLLSTSTIRLLCQMLREPLFDELRTKQTIGYIVSSYYDLGYSSLPDTGLPRSNTVVPVDYIVINVLSRKLSPPDIVKRIDDFLVTFRHSLENMPASEISHHADALSTKMLKPIQKLGTEASSRFAKIRRCAPEALASDFDIPWDNAPVLARTIKTLTRKDLLNTFDKIMAPSAKSKITTCVYGNTFPLPKTLRGSRHVVVNDLPRLVEYRKRLSVFELAPPSHFLGRFSRSQAQFALASLAAAATVLGGYFIVSSRTKKGR